MARVSSILLNNNVKFQFQLKFQDQFDIHLFGESGKKTTLCTFCLPWLTTQGSPREIFHVHEYLMDTGTQTWIVMDESWILWDFFQHKLFKFIKFLLLPLI